jgi:hypothetical protein
MQVRAIRAEYATGLLTMRQLAALYGISESQIGRIIGRQRWAHLD